MPSKWETTTLREIAEFKFSNVDKHIVHGEASVRLCNYLDVYRNRKLTANMPYSEGSARPAEIKRFAIHKGDVLITKDSETPDDIGVPALVVDDLPNTICGYHLAIIRANGKIEPCFLALHLQSEAAKCHFLRFANGVTRFGIGLRAIGSLPVPMLPHDEQIAIAAILDAVDVAIERTRTAIATAEKLKRALLQKLMRSRRGWKEKTLAEVAEVNRGKFTPRPRNDPRYYGGKFPFIQTGNITRSNGRRITEFGQTLNELGIEVSRGFPVGTIAVTIAANIADTAILGIPMYFPDSVVGVNVNPPNNARFIELCIRVAKPRLEAQAPHSAQKNLSLKFLRRLRLSVPSPEEQEQIASVYEAADDVVQMNETSLTNLEKLKHGLMQDLLTGRVRVKLPASSGNGVVRSRT